MITIPEPIAKWLESLSALNFLLWISAIWLLLWGVVRTIRNIFPAVKKFIELSESLQRLPDWMDSVDDRLDDIRHEMHPNNGGSMRDDIQTLNLQVEQLKAHQINDYNRHDALETTIARRLSLRAEKEKEREGRNDSEQQDL